MKGKKSITWAELTDDILALNILLRSNKVEKIYGIPKGGTIISLFLSAYKNYNNIKVVVDEENITEDTWIVDDLADTGKILEPWIKKGYKTAILYKKKRCKIKPNIVIKEIGNDWIELPYERQQAKDVGIEDHIIRILEFINENPNREGLKETPKRVAKAYEKIFGGYNQDPKGILKTFKSEKYDQMIWLTNIELYSTCEHHMLPFIGKCHIAYVPNKKLVGVSKLARLVEIFARRLQIQERLTYQIANTLQEVLKPKGVAVVIEAQHLCMMARGVEKQNSIMKTAHLTGVFLDDKENARAEFYSLINK